MIRKNIIVSVGIILVWVIIVICIFRLSLIENRLIISVDGFKIDKTENITIGNTSDICFDKIPKDYLTVTFDSDSNKFSWNVNPHYAQVDSLLYLKINNENTNIHGLNYNDLIHIHKGGMAISVPVHEILGELDNKCKSEYVPVKWLLAHRQHRDSTFLDYDFLNDDALKSFIYRDKKGKGAPRLVILDTATTLQHGGTAIGYTMGGDVFSEEGLKVQFFKTVSSSYEEKKVKEDYFHIDEINYIMKPVVVATEWGAGHVMLKSEHQNINVSFPKPITYVETMHKLDSLGKHSSNVVTFRQRARASLLTNDLFFPYFSSAVPQDVCTLVLDSASVKCGERNVVYQRGFLPKIESFKSDVNENVIMRMGLIGFGYYLSFLWLPFVVFLVISFKYSYLIRIKGSSNSSQCGFFIKVLPRYSKFIFSMAFAYSICRVLIAIKLSYTHPYFDKLTAIIPISASAIILLVFNLSILFNYNIVHPTCFGNEKYYIGNTKVHRKWLAFVISALSLLGICYCMVKMDKNYNMAVLGSYLFNENATLFPVHNLYPWNWCKESMHAMNDLHRNVPFMLIFANFVACLVLLIFNLMGGKIMDGINKINNKLENDSGVWKFWKWFGLTALGAAIVFFVSLAPGNFSSALITLFLVPFLCLSLSQTDQFQKKGVFAQVLQFMLAATLFLIAAFAIGDRGYITNSFGIVGFILVVYAVMRIDYKNITQQELKNKSSLHYIVLISFLLVLIFVIGLPQIVKKLGDYDRVHQRVEYNLNYNEYVASGSRSALNVNEFMLVLSHNMFNKDGSDPLSIEHHPLHASVSSGQSPTILNDVSVPGAFIGAYGRWAVCVYISLPLLLLVVVLTCFVRTENIRITRRALCRALAAFMWAGTTLYLCLSYINAPFVPYTGRLNPGMGVDSVGEALESAVLLAFMLAGKLTAEDGENNG